MKSTSYDRIEGILSVLMSFAFVIDPSFNLPNLKLLKDTPFDEDQNVEVSFTQDIVDQVA